MQGLLDSKIGPLHHLTKNLPTLIYENDTMPEEILGSSGASVVCSLHKTGLLIITAKFWRLR